MRLEDLTAEVRPRGHWEAVDLGFALTRQHFPKLLLAWVLAVWPLWGLLLAASHWLPLWLITMIIWWLKPLYDRIPLYHLSRSLFGATPKLGETLRAWPRLFFKSLPSALITRRLSMSRGLLLPITMLEQLRGKAWKARARVITTHSGGASSSLLFVCALYELVMVAGIFFLAQMFIPEGLGSDFWQSVIDSGLAHLELPMSIQWIFVGCWLLSMTFVEIFYIGGSFGLYVNCRTQLEGWDVELTFRRMALRWGKVAAALVVLAFLTLNAHSATRKLPTLDEEKQEHNERITRVLGDDAFKIYKEKRKIWDSDQERSGLNLAWLEVVGRVIFWLLIAAAIVWLAYFIAKNRHWFSRKPSAAAKETLSSPKTLMGMDVEPESLPADIVGAAMKLWQSGDTHAALALLYRGAISSLIHSSRLPLRESHTEGDCVALASSLPERQKVDYFTRLTTNWISIAYASREPQSGDMQTLFAGWPFENGGRSK